MPPEIFSSCCLSVEWYCLLLYLSIHKKKGLETGEEQETQTSAEYQMDGKEDQKDGKTRPKKSKKRGPGRGTITLGGLRKVEKAKKRKGRQRVKKKMGKVGVHDGRKPGKKTGRIPPTRSVIFLDNTVGELTRRFQAAEEEAGRVTGHRIRITESAGVPLSLIFSSTDPWGPQYCERPECVPCMQQDETKINCRKRNILYES